MNRTRGGRLQTSLRFMSRRSVPAAILWPRTNSTDSESFSWVTIADLVAIHVASFTESFPAVILWIAAAAAHAMECERVNNSDGV
jgi:hypothetical protein